MPLMEYVLKLLILIPQEMVHQDLAKKAVAPKILSTSKDTETFKEFLVFKTKMPNNPALLPSMPKIGPLMEVVFSTTVELTSITPSYLLDTLANIGSSKTLGVPHGENLDISDLPEELPLVVLLMMPLMPNIEKII